MLLQYWQRTELDIAADTFADQPNSLGLEGLQGKPTAGTLLG
jgi:hypothetical protein